MLSSPAVSRGLMLGFFVRRGKVMQYEDMVIVADLVASQAKACSGDPGATDFHAVYDLSLGEAHNIGLTALVHSFEVCC